MSVDNTKLVCHTTLGSILFVCILEFTQAPVFTTA